ncbi:MAG: NAD(P) transhydrogenase subunit alpha [Myxococcota bacterium]
MEVVTIPHVVMQLYILVLSALVGFEVISKVPVLLHTPLMSGANALSGIVVVGALTLSCSAASWLGYALALAAVFLATVNVVGGFVVTDRMLAMFRSKKPTASKQSSPNSTRES